MTYWHALALFVLAAVALAAGAVGCAALDDALDRFRIDVGSLLVAVVLLAGALAAAAGVVALV